MSARSRSRSPFRNEGSDSRRSNRDGDGSSGGGRGLSRHSDKIFYITNLPFEMTWMELKDLCRDKAGEVCFVDTLKDRNGRSKGTGVVEFKTREAAEKCSENINGMDIKGRLVGATKIRDPVAFFRKVKEDTGHDFLNLGDRSVTRDRGDQRGANRDNRGGGMMGGAVMDGDPATYGLSMSFLDSLGIKTPLVNRVFIANISYNCGVGRLFDICSLAGQISWFDLQLDQDGRSRGMAVVEYSHPIEAVQAISMLHNQRLYDRTLNVKMDRFDKEESRRREGELPTGLRGVGTGLGANGAPLANVASVIGSSYAGGGGGSFHSHLNGGAGAVPAVMLNGISPFVGGVASGVMNQPFAAPYPLQQLSVFQQQPVSNESLAQQQAAASFQNPQLVPGTAPATAYPAQYSQSAAVLQAQLQAGQQQQQQLYSAGQMIQQPHPGTLQAAPQQQQMIGQGGSGMVVTSTGYDSASTQQATRVILIKNLPHEYTWQIVSDRLQQFGELESVEMVSQGVAKIRFARLADAERAKATLQGAIVEGHAIGTEFL